jgi:hypothetical protein
MITSGRLRLREGAARGRDVRGEDVCAAHGTGDARRAHARPELDDLVRGKAGLRVRVKGEGGPPLEA